MEIMMILLFPILLPMKGLLEVFYALFHSYGLSIITTSIVVRLILTPIIHYASRMEERENFVQEKMAPELATVKANYKGRERFEQIDAVYQKYNYHPIKSMASLVPLLLQIPFLLAALFLLVNYPPSVGASFVSIADLSKPDGLLVLGNNFTANLLPIALTGVAVIESFIKPNSTMQTRVRFLVVAAVLLFLIYPLSAAVCLYWFTSNTLSFLATINKRIAL